MQSGADQGCCRCCWCIWSVRVRRSRGVAEFLTPTQHLSPVVLEPSPEQLLGRGTRCGRPWAHRRCGVAVGNSETLGPGGHSVLWSSRKHTPSSHRAAVYFFYLCSRLPRYRRCSRGQDRTWSLWVELPLAPYRAPVAPAPFSWVVCNL